MKKLLYITSRVFWPTKSGHEVHIYNYCRILSKIMGYKVDVYIIDNRTKVETALDNKPPFIEQVFCGEKISKVSIVDNLVKKSLVCKEHWPLQSCLYYSKNNCARLECLNTSNQYDVLFVDMVRLATYLNAFSNLPQLCVLDMGDILSKRYNRQIHNVSEESNVGGAYTSGMSSFLRLLLKTKLIQKMILEIESKLMSTSELFWAERYNRVILVSSVETEELNSQLSKPKAVTVHVGIDSEYYGSKQDIAREEGYVSFVGDMCTSANSDTVSYIVNDILPLCTNVKKILFIGKCPDNLQTLYKDDSRVQFVGMVDDIRSEIQSTSVFLAPMAYGTGIKIKIIEAMALGMAVVTNPIGAEGIPGVNGVHWFVGKTNQEIAEYVDELLKNDEECIDMGTKAKKLVDSYFSLDASAKAFTTAGL